MNPVSHSDALIEPNQICAAAEENVLAVVDDLIDPRVTVRACATAKVSAALDELDAQTGLSEGASGAHAGHATTNYNCRLLSIRLQRVDHSNGFRNASLIIADGTIIRR